MLINLPLLGSRFKILEPWSVVIPYDNSALIKLLTTENEVGSALNVHIDVPMIWRTDTIFLIKRFEMSRFSSWVFLSVQKSPDHRFVSKIPFHLDMLQTPDIPYQLVVK
jgi:hypothetical protein